MIDFDDFVRKDIRNPGHTLDGFGGRKVAALKMSMTVQMITRLGNPQKPVDGFQSPVGMRFLVMDAERRRVGDEDVEGASILEPVQQQAGQQAERPQVGFALRILISAIGAVADAPTKAADQKLLEADHLQVHVGTAFHMCQ